jgi:hypothetical protein
MVFVAVFVATPTTAILLGTGALLLPFHHPGGAAAPPDIPAGCAIGLLRGTHRPASRKTLTL